MPAILHEQFRIFRFGPLHGLESVDPERLAPAGLGKEALEQLPLGVPIWAKLSEAAEAKLEPETGRRDKVRMASHVRSSAREALKPSGP